jgi:hypothetical protein
MTSLIKSSFACTVGGKKKIFLFEFIAEGMETAKTEARRRKKFFI